MKQIKLVIDDDTLKHYEEYYFGMYPRRKKRPISNPRHESINEWMILKRQSMNNLKQRWKEFIIWLIADAGFSDMKIDKCEIRQKVYFPTTRRADIDNTVPKFILDGFVESGMIIDDSYTHIKKLVLEAGYDKERPRTELTIKILDE